MKKIRKMIVALLLTVAMLVPMAVPVMASPSWEDLMALQAEIDNLRRINNELREQIYELETGQRAPLVHLVNPQNILVEPGDDEEISLTIRNIGSQPAHSLLTTAVVSTGAPFIIEFANNANRLTILQQSSQRNMTMRIIVDADAEPGATGTITLTHRYSTHLGASLDTTDTIHVRVGGDAAGTVGLRLTNIRTSETNVGQDQEFRINATLQNTGTASASEIQIGIANLDTDSIILTSDLSDAAFETLEPGESRQVSFTFRTARDITSGFYAIYFRLLYDNVAEGRLPIPFYITVVADYATTSPNIEIRALSVPTTRLNVGQSGNISFEIVNNGDAVAHNIRVTATPQTDGALVPTTSNIQSTQSLGVGDARSFQFGFMPTSRAETQSHAIRLSVEYEIRGSTGEPSPFVQYVALNVYNPPEEEDDDDEDTGRRQIPRIIASVDSLYPQIPLAGENFEIQITFLNTSRSRSVNNIRVVLESPLATGTGTDAASSAVFTPVGGSNTLFVDYLSPGEAVTRTVTMFTIPDAAPRIYALQLSVDYQDEDYYVHDDMVLLSIPVTQFARIETQPPELSIMPFMDMFGFVDFEFNIMNTGRVNLRNLRVRVDGAFDTHQANDYMGNLRMGQVVNFRGRIFPLEPGFQEGAIVIYAEDDAGEIVELVHPLAIDVMGGFDDFGDFGDFGDRDFIIDGDEWFEGGADRFPEMGFDGGFFGEDGEEGGIFSRMWSFMRRPVFWGPAAGVVAVAVIAVIVIINKKRSMLDFDDEQ